MLAISKVIIAALPVSGEASGSAWLAAKRAEEGVCVTGKVAPANILLSHRQPLLDAGDGQDRLGTGGSKERSPHITTAGAMGFGRSEGQVQPLRAGRSSACGGSPCSGQGSVWQSAKAHDGLPFRASLIFDQATILRFFHEARHRGESFSTAWIVAFIAIGAIIIVVVSPLMCLRRRPTSTDEEYREAHEAAEYHEAWFRPNAPTLKEKAGALLSRGSAPKAGTGDRASAAYSNAPVLPHGSIHTTTRRGVAKSACNAGASSSHSHVPQSRMGHEAGGILHDAQQSLGAVGAVLDKTGDAITGRVAGVVEDAGDILDAATAVTNRTFKATKKIFKKVKKTGEKMHDRLDEEMDKAVYAATMGSEP